MPRRYLLSIDSGDILFCQSHKSLGTRLYRRLLVL